MIEKSIILVTAIIFGTTVGLTPILVQLQQASSFIQRIADAPLASSGDNVYVVWSSNKTGNWEILFRASIDGGKTFGDKINLSNSTNANSAHPDISASGNNVHVSFHDNKTGSVDTYAITSTDKGKTFGDIVAINGTGTMPQKTKIVTIPGLDILGDSEENTQVSSSGNSVYVVSWDKKAGNWEVFLARSTDNGKTFGDTTNLSNSSDTKSDRAMIDADGKNVYTTWWETSQNGTSIPVFRASNDNGETFGPTLKLAANGTIGG